MRSLGKARELRRNPLAREAFASLDEVSACRAIETRVRSAISAIVSPRWSAILLRADTLGHSPAAVAGDLGISVRQYHRERRLAHAAFYNAYRSVLDSSQIVVDGDGVHRQLRIANAAADSGDAASARAILEDAAGTGGFVRCDALVRLAVVETWANRFDAAADALRAARRSFAEEHIPQHLRAQLADAELAASLSLQAFSHGPEAVRNANVSGVESRFARADAAFISGDPEAAQTIVHAVAAGETSDGTSIDALIMRGELANFTTADGVRSDAAFAEAMALAKSRRMGGRYLYAESHRLISRWMHSRVSSDRAAYRSLVDNVDPALPARLRMYLAISAADVELAIGSAHRAVRFAERALALSRSAYDRLSAHALLAAALFRLGRLEEAVYQAGVAADGARSARYLRILSLAQRVNAQASLSGGQPRRACDAIEESLDCARTSSSLYVCRKTEGVRAQIRAACKDGYNGAAGSKAIPKG